jgi:hypothetical protein
MAQAFTAAGDGYVLRGGPVEWDPSQGRTPHLTKESAASLLRRVVELYSKQNRGANPSRICLHKSSRFSQPELEGFKEAVSSVPASDFVALERSDIQFYRPGLYPPLRGTYVNLDDHRYLLYSVGYVPFLRTYQGSRVPRALEVLEHYGDTPWDVMLHDILALTKLNWNTADFACSDPVTIGFSRRVGLILAELTHPDDARPEYRFYM